MSYRDFTVRDAVACGGQPVFRRTRVLRRTVLGYLSRDAFNEEIRADSATRTEDVRAAIALAAAAAADDLSAAQSDPVRQRSVMRECVVEWLARDEAQTWGGRGCVATHRKIRVLRPEETGDA